MRRLLMIALAVAASFTTNSAQAVNGADIVREIRILVDQSDSTEGATNYSNTEIRSAWNMAQRAMSRWTPLIESDTAFRCLANKIMYPLATNVAKVSGVWFRPEVGVWLYMERASGDNFGRIDSVQSRRTDQRKPFQYNFHAGAVKIYPALPSYAPTDSLMIDVLVYPSDVVNDTSTVSLVGYAILPAQKLAIWILENGQLSVGDDAGSLANLENLARLFLGQGNVEGGR